MTRYLGRILRFGPVVLAVAGIGEASAASFKAQYYPECYAPVAEARGLVPPPPMDVAGTAKKAGDVAGALGKLGGVPGLGGLGALGGLGRAASTAQQVSTYSNLLADAAKFTQKMQQDYPDAATRLAAYGDKMGGDADTIGDAALKLDGAQTCYENAYTALKAGVSSGEIKSTDAAKRQKEIVAGLEEAMDVLGDSRTTMDMNMKSYNEALTTDTSGMGFNLGTLAQAASVGQTAAGAVGAGSINPLNSQLMANQARRAAASGMYANYYNQTNAYTGAWWDAYNRSGGDTATANAAAQAALGGSASPVKGYQEAYWKAQAVAAAKGTPLSAASSAVSGMGALNALSSFGGISGLSSGGLAWVAANQAVGAVGNAVNSGGDTPAAAPAPAAAAAGANIGQAIGAANALRGLSGGGAAFVGANLAAGAIGNAINGGGQQTQAAAPTELSPAMEDSLFKTSVDSSKFSDAYGLVSWQAQRNTEITAAAKAKLN